MGFDVTVLRVFTDRHGQFGNPLGVVDAALVPAAERQALAHELGYSETIFVDLPAGGATAASAHIFTPATELPFAGHPTVGATWWLADRGTPVRTLEVPAGRIEVGIESRPDGDVAVITGRAEWAPVFVTHELASPDEVLAADPADYADAEHYVWAWLDRDDGVIRSRSFAAHLGVPEDEATGAAAVRMTDQLRRDLTITQGRGSQIRTWWDPAGWVTVAGRVVDDGPRRVG